MPKSAIIGGAGTSVPLLVLVLVVMPEVDELLEVEDEVLELDEVDELVDVELEELVLEVMLPDVEVLVDTSPEVEVEVDDDELTSPDVEVDVELEELTSPDEDELTSPEEELVVVLLT